jgi:hypothetical protein
MQLHTRAPQHQVNAPSTFSMLVRKVLEGCFHRLVPHNGCLNDVYACNMDQPHVDDVSCDGMSYEKSTLRYY